jgi:hypothetical protein
MKTEKQVVHELERKDLAKQLVTYADSVTAFSFLQSVAFGFALGQRDFRESVSRGPWAVAGCLTMAYISYTLFLSWCRMGEAALLVAQDISTSEDVILAKWRTIVWRFRFGVLLLGLILSLTTLGLVLHIF